MKAKRVNSKQPGVNPIVQLAERFVSSLKQEGKFYRYGNALVIPETDKQLGTGHLKTLINGDLEWLLRRFFPAERESTIRTVAKDILHHPELPLPQISSLVTTPTFREDLSLVTEAGFDERSGLYYAPDASLANFTFSTSANRATAETSLALLFELVTDFPFKHPQKDRMAYLAALLTLFLRSSIHAVVPAFALDANGQSAGKGLLAAILSLIAYGKDPAPMGAPEGRGEWTSKLDAIVLKGEPFQHIDNIVQKLTNDDFASLLTSMIRTIRIKGLTKVVQIPANTVWILSANGLDTDADMAQRLIVSYLEHPDAASRKQENFHIQKTYKCSIETLLRQHRAKYMQAALDLICAWVNDGAPRRQKLVLAKYGEWEAVVGGIFDWLKLEPVFLSDHLKDALSVDGEKTETISFLRQLIAAFPDCATDPISAADISDKVFPGEGQKSTLRDFLPDALQRKEGSFSRRLGRWLTKAATKRWGNIELIAIPDTHLGIQTYKIGIGIKAKLTKGLDAEFEQDESAAA